MENPDNALNDFRLGLTIRAGRGLPAHDLINQWYHNLPRAKNGKVHHDLVTQTILRAMVEFIQKQQGIPSNQSDLMFTPHFVMNKPKEESVKTDNQWQMSSQTKPEIVPSAPVIEQRQERPKDSLLGLSDEEEVVIEPEPRRVSLSSLQSVISSN